MFNTKLVMALVGAISWGAAAYAFDQPWLWLLAVLSTAFSFSNPLPPLPKIGDYEDDEQD